MALNSFICDWCFTAFIQSSLLLLWFLINWKCCAPVPSWSHSSTPAPEEPSRPAQEDGEETLVCWPPRASILNTRASRTGRKKWLFHSFTLPSYISQSPTMSLRQQVTLTVVWLMPSWRCGRLLLGLKIESRRGTSLIEEAPRVSAAAAASPTSHPGAADLQTSRAFRESIQNNPTLLQWPPTHHNLQVTQSRSCCLFLLSSILVSSLNPVIAGIGWN